MLTPIEIQGKVFKSGLGYDKKDVDAFMKEISMNYEKLYKESVELNDKISVLSEGLQYYKSIEKTLQKALVLAEKTAQDTQEAAVKKAEATMQQAKVDAKLIVADAKNELEKIHLKTIQLIQQYDKYKAQFAHLAATQMDLLNSDCFQIKLADLDTFLNATNEENLKKMHDEEDVTIESVNTVEKLPDSEDELIEEMIRLEDTELNSYSTKEQNEDDLQDPFEFIQDQE